MNRYRQIVERIEKVVRARFSEHVQRISLPVRVCVVIGSPNELPKGKEVLRCARPRALSPARRSSCLGGIMPKFPLAVSVVASVLVALGTRTVAQTFPPELPLAIICWNQQTKYWAVAYLQTVK